MASDVIANLRFVNPATNRVLSSFRTISQFIRQGTFPVPNGLLLSTTGRLVLNNSRNRRRIEDNGFDIVERRPVIYTRVQNNPPSPTDPDWESFKYRYVLDIIRRSGLRGRIAISFVTFNDGILRTVYYDVPQNPTDTWWKFIKGWEKWEDEYDTKIWSILDSSWFTIVKLSAVVPAVFAQQFQEGYSNCLLTPIKEYFGKQQSEAKSKQDRYRFNKKVKIIDELLLKYYQGVPQTHLNDIVNKLSISIKIYDIPGNAIFEERTTGKVLKVFEFINTKLNHVELKNTTNQIEISPEEFNEKIIDVTSGDYFIPNHKLITKEGTFIVKDDVKEKVKQWEIDQGLDYTTQMEYFSDPELYEYVLSGCHYGGYLNYNENGLDGEPELFLLDHEKSYANYKKCHLYKDYKFPGTPTHFRYVPEDFPFEKYNGTWTIENIDLSSMKVSFSGHQQRLKIYEQGAQYSTPELYTMKHILGIKFKLIGGSFTHEQIDFDMKDLVAIKGHLNKQGKEIKPYKIWAGRQAMIRIDDSIIIKGDEKMAKHLTASYGKDRIRFNKFNDEIHLYTRKTKFFGRPHIASYILSYSRIQILMQLIAIPPEKVLRIELDGIYYTKWDGPVVESFQSKPVEYKNTRNCLAYISVQEQREWSFGDYEEFCKHKLINVSGEGGAGKTYKFLTDRGLIDPCYIAMENRVLAEKRKEYGIKNTCTIARLLGQGRPHSGSTKVLLIDESSKVNDTEKNTIISKYPNSIIIFCGDECQLGPIQGIRADYSKFYQINIDGNRRCKDPKLQKILTEQRKLIKSNASIDAIRHHALLALENNKGNDNEYKVNEYIICSTHKRLNEFTKKHENMPKKWLVTGTTQDNYNGDIIISETQPKCSILRHAFTAHATQGMTIKSPDKLYIDPNYWFEREMIYTILSRVEYLDQIVLLT